jgi:hypothetical protein
MDDIALSTLKGRRISNQISHDPYTACAPITAKSLLRTSRLYRVFATFLTETRLVCCDSACHVKRASDGQHQRPEDGVVFITVLCVFLQPSRYYLSRKNVRLLGMSDLGKENLASGPPEGASGSPVYKSGQLICNL